MGLEEKDYAEALGVELPEAEPATEPAAEPADTGSAEVNTDTGTDAGDNGTGGVDNTSGNGGEDPAVDPNASAAARRRAMESRIERERERAKQEERARMISEIKRANAAKASAVTPPTNTPPAPTNTPPARDSSGRFAKRGQPQSGTDPAPADDLSARVGAIIDNHPAVRAAKEYTEKMRENEVRSAFAEDLAKITEMDPSIKTEDDLLALPEHDLILGLVNKGYSPSDAYKTVFFDKITAAAVERGKRQAEAQAQSKAHQIPDKHRGTGGDTVVQVPSEIMQMYREMMPGMSDADIVKHYEKFRK